jgi:hypothetical protein
VAVHQSDEHREKIDHLIAAKTLPCKMHLLIDLVENMVLLKVSADYYDFPKPARGRGVGFRSRLDFYRSVGNTGHAYLHGSRSVVCFLFKEAYFYTDWLPVTPRCASRGPFVRDDSEDARH